MHAQPTLRTPARWLLAVLLYNVVGIALVCELATRAPWLGLSLKANEQGVIQVVAAQGPAAGVPVGSQLRRLSAETGGAAVDLIADDLMEEPDLVADYRQMDAFFARQEAIAAILAQPRVRLMWRSDTNAPEQQSVVQPAARPLEALPLLFWYQLAISVSGCLIACWVWVLRPRDWGARLFGITGLLFPVFVMPAAVYSSRELALPGELFFALSALNHWGAFMFGAAVISILLSHPRALVKPRHLVWPFVAFSGCWLMDVTRLAPDLDWGNRYVVLSELLIATLAGVLQWRRSKGEPVERASLRWLIVSLLLGSGLFILTIVATASLGWLPPMPQGYAFGFFLFIYIGIALGLRRYRLFELDEWAYRMLVWVGGALAVVGLDALLIAGLGWSGEPALGLSVWLCGMLYFPARQWLWQRLIPRPRLQLHQLMPDVVRIAFEPSRQGQEAMWADLLQRLYDPLELQDAPTSPAHTQVEEDGLGLRVPGCAGLAARLMRYPERGQRLFSPKDATFIQALCQLMDQAEHSRVAQARGASEERRRIVRDMHDDVGARLLMIIHRAPDPDLAELGRAAMNDLRTALAVLDAGPVLLTDALADWRAEATARCEAASANLRWQTRLPEAEKYLPTRQKSLLERALRECLTNALKHAAPRQVEVVFHWLPDCLTLAVRNDGGMIDPALWAEGRGLRGLRQRLSEQAGELALKTLADGRTEVLLRLPLTVEEAT